MYITGITGQHGSRVCRHTTAHEFMAYVGHEGHNRGNNYSSLLAVRIEPEMVFGESYAPKHGAGKEPVLKLVLGRNRGSFLLQSIPSGWQLSTSLPRHTVEWFGWQSGPAVLVNRIPGCCTWDAAVPGCHIQNPWHCPVLLPAQRWDGDQA